MPEPLPIGDLELRIVGLGSPEAKRLNERMISEMDDRYGDGGPAPVPPERFDEPEGCFLVAFEGDQPVGCGGFRRLGTRRAEIKRMYVVPVARGRGVGRMILQRLEAMAALVGYGEIWLECGTEQPEGVALYLSQGYQSMSPYGEFEKDPRSRCFRHSLISES